MRLLSRKTALLLPVLIVLVVVLGFFLAPWKLALGRKLEAVMERYGFHHVSLRVSSVGWHSATLEDISIGDKTPLTLKSLVLHYRPQELRNGTLQNLALGGLALAVRHGADGWRIAGLDAAAAGPSTGAPFAFPVTAARLNALPFHTLGIADSSLSVLSDAWRLDMPLTLAFQTTPGKLTYDADHLTFRMGATEIDTGTAALTLSLDEKAGQWNGPWSVQNLSLKGGSALPAMNGAGTLAVTADTIAARGVFANKDKSYTAAFTLAASLTDPAKTILTVTAASLPWNKGTLSLRKVTIPLNGAAPITVKIHVDSVSVDDLMQALTGKRVTATGTVSGDVPVTIGRDGNIAVGDGGLKASGPGRISMPPGIIPGDNAQIALVRTLLQDLHYTDLQVSLGNDARHKLAVTMTVQGNNPAVYNGRPVKLNVHLHGDVLDLVRQNVMLLTNPKQMLNQGP